MGAKIEDAILGEMTRLRLGSEHAFTRLGPEQDVALGSMEPATDLAEYVGGLRQWVPGANLVSFGMVCARAHPWSDNWGRVHHRWLGALLLVPRVLCLLFIVPSPLRVILLPIKQGISNTEVGP